MPTLRAALTGRTESVDQALVTLSPRWTTWTLQTLRQHETMRPAEIGAAMPWNSYPTTIQVLNRMYAQGLVDRHGHGTYGVTAAGRATGPVHRALADWHRTHFTPATADAERAEETLARLRPVGTTATLGALDRHGPLTYPEIVETTGLPPSSAHQRLARMERDGLIVRDSPRKGTRYELSPAAEQLGDAPRAHHRLLQIVEPGGEGEQRAPQEQRVREGGERGPGGEPPGGVQPDADREGEDDAERGERLDGGGPADGDPGGGAGPPAEVREPQLQGAEGVRGRAVHAQLLGSGEPFLQEAEEIGGAALTRRDQRQGAPGEPVQQDDGGQRERGEDQPDPPVEEEERDQDAEDEGEMGQYLQHEGGHHPGEPGHVPVDPFDQLSRGMLLVEAGGAAQTAVDQLGAEAVGAAPGEPYGDRVAADDHGHLSGRRGEIPQGDTGQRGGRAVVQGRVHEAAQQLGGGELKGDTRGNQQGEQGHGTALAPQITGESGQLPQGTEGQRLPSPFVIRGGSRQHKEAAGFWEWG